MTGSNIFVMYTSSDGSNVTLSPRLGTGHVMPEHDTAAKITVLSGSGVSNGVMTANVQCSNCDSWSGGTMDFSSSSGDWIYALKSGSALNSNSLTETINQHDSASAFTWDMSQAQGGSDVNPFVSTGSTGSSGSDSAASSAGGSNGVPATCTPIAASSAAASTTGGSGATGTLAAPSGSGCPTAWPTEFSTSWPTARPTWASSCFPSGHPGGSGGHGPWPTHPPRAVQNVQKRNDGCPSGYASVNSGSISQDGAVLSVSQQRSMLLAHGVLAGIAFVALFPIGGILIRIANFTGLMWVHAALQLFAYLVYIVAFAMGVYMATHLGLMNNAHPIIGIALFMILLLQPVFGFLHHRLFKKYSHRTLWSYAHIWHGRAAILLGMVNGGLGIKLAGTASMGQKIAYGVLAGLMGVIYIAAIVFGELKRKKSTPPSYEKSQRNQQYNSSEENVPNNGEYYGKDGQRVAYQGA